MQPRMSPAGSAGLLSVLVVLAVTAAGSAYVVLMPGPAEAPLPMPEAAQERPSRVGLMPYNGPLTASDLIAACPGGTQMEMVLCWSDVLDALLEGKGATVAFDVLEDLTMMDPLASTQGHAMAHGLGRFAYDAYGSIGRALTDCSYKVFGGCVHGALQSYFDALGRPVQPSDIRDICPTDSTFTQYTCLHGLGHGLMLNRNYDLNGSARLCEALDGFFAEESCYGGVFMENWVGYLDSIQPTDAGGHDHEHGPPPAFHIHPDDPAYPCNVVPGRWGRGCWIMQTSIMLYFNHMDFAAAARVCEQQTNDDFRDTCFKSLGRDSSPFTNHDPLAAEAICMLVPSGSGDCIRGFVADVTLLAVQPMDGLRACQAISPTNKPDCYHEWGWQSVGMVGKTEMARLCALSEESYADDCRDGAHL